MQKEFKIKIVLIYLNFGFKYFKTGTRNQGEKGQNNNFPKCINFINFGS